MEADTGEKVLEIAGSKPFARGGRHVIGGAPSLVAYLPIFGSKSITTLDAGTRESFVDLPAHPARVVAVTVARDARIAVTVDAQGGVRSWDPTSDTALASAEVAGDVTAVAVDATGGRAAVVADGAVQLVELGAAPRR